MNAEHEALIRVARVAVGSLRATSDLMAADLVERLADTLANLDVEAAALQHDLDRARAALNAEVQAKERGPYYIDKLAGFYDVRLGDPDGQNHFVSPADVVAELNRLTAQAEVASNADHAGLIAEAAELERWAQANTSDWRSDLVQRLADDLERAEATTRERCAQIVLAHKPDASFGDSASEAVERAALLANVAAEIRGAG